MLFLIKPSFEILSHPGPSLLEDIEKAARTCYKSEDKITPGSAEELCRKLKKRGHFPMLEFASLTVRFVIDRGVSHELVRHRLCSFAQESTRYCNYGGGVTFVIPPWVGVRVKAGEYGEQPFLQVKGRDNRIWAEAMLDAEANYLELLDKGWKPQQARSVLPNSLKTEIVVKANFVEWLHIFKLRCASAAHPQMQEVMIPLRKKVGELIPVIFEESTSPVFED